MAKHESRPAGEHLLAPAGFCGLDHIFTEWDMAGAQNLKCRQGRIQDRAARRR